jgi:rfaE bifunctional protein kinase chain/domain
LAFAPSEELLKTVDSFQGKRILVIGDLMIDRYVHCRARKLSREAPVPVADYKDEVFTLGGAGNLINNILALGGSVSAVGMTGSDEPGIWLRNELERRRVDLRGVIVHKRPTTLKTRIILNDRQYIRIDREIREEVEPTVTKQFLSLLDDLVKECDCVVFSDYDKGVITSELIGAVVDACRLHDRKTIAQPKVRHYMDYVGVTMLKSNAREGGIATGISIINDTSLRNMGFNLLTRLEAKSVLLTSSDEGMTLFENKNITYFPPLKGPNSNFSAVGIRDCMTAVLALSLSSGASTRDSALLSNIAAAVRGEKLATTVVELAELRTHVPDSSSLTHEIIQVPVR